jgi:hypothetical protein
MIESIQYNAYVHKVIMKKLYCFLCLLVTCEILALHLLCINGQLTVDKDYSQRSAMKQVNNDMRGMHTWMVQIQETLNTIQKELQQHRDELRVVGQQCECLQRKMEKQLDRENIVTDMNTTGPVAPTNGSGSRDTGPSGKSTGPLKILSGGRTFVVQGFSAHRKSYSNALQLDGIWLLVYPLSSLVSGVNQVDLIAF